MKVEAVDLMEPRYVVIYAQALRQREHVYPCQLVCSQIDFHQRFLDFVCLINSLFARKHFQGKLSFSENIL